MKLGQRDHQAPEDMVNLEELLSELIECYLEVRACGMVIDNCGINESELISGNEMGR